MLASVLSNPKFGLSLTPSVANFGSGTRVIWFAIGVLAIADALFCHHLQIRFYHWTPLAAASVVIGVIATFYQVFRRSDALARAARWALLWLLFVNAGTVLIYVAAACGGPAQDAALHAIDAAIGFDWGAWHHFLTRRPELGFVLWLAYVSLFPQILVSIFWLSRAGLDYYNYELLLNNIISLLVTVTIFLMFPALGHQDTPRGPDLSVLLALRGGGPWSFDLMHLQGLISFPSYHTVLAVLLTYSHRRSALFAPVVAINTVMLVSIPPIGQHYLIDVFGGAAVSLLAIAASGAALQPHRLGIRRGRRRRCNPA